MDGRRSCRAIYLRRFDGRSISGTWISFDATAKERDRTPEEIQQGVWSVWVVDLGLVQVEIVFTRSATGDWHANADVPNSPIVCPPSTLTATLNKTSADSGTEIVRNPEKPGDYTVESIFSSTEGSMHVVKQKIKITKQRCAGRSGMEAY
jgi:hypothetical protein